MNISEFTLSGLRNLRLWHWKQSKVQDCVARNLSFHSNVRERAIRQSTLHLHAVQFLNELFPLGDTAEQDEAKEQTAIAGQPNG